MDSLEQKNLWLFWYYVINPYWIFYVLHVSWYLSLLGVFYFFVPGAVENRLERFAVAVALLLVPGSTCFSNKFIIARNIKFYEYLTNLRSRLDARLLAAQQIPKKQWQAFTIAKNRYLLYFQRTLSIKILTVTARYKQVTREEKP